MCGIEVISDEGRKHIAAYAAKFREVSKSPFGDADEIGMLNLMTTANAREVMSRVDASLIVDLSVDLFVGMPSWQQAGDPPFQQWMTHTPSGSVVDDLTEMGEAQNRLVSYSGDAISMYTHTGTHLDTLNHFGYGGLIWNGFSEELHLSSRHWTKCGADKVPPIVGRAVLFDIAGVHGVDLLPDNYGITAQDLQAALQHTQVSFNPGDIAVLRTGRMKRWPDQQGYVQDSPGLSLDGARFLACRGAALICGDTSTIEPGRSDDPENWQEVHTYLLGAAGIPVMEVVDCERLVAEGIAEFAMVAAGLKIRGATGAPVRPLAMPFAGR